MQKELPQRVHGASWTFSLEEPKGLQKAQDNPEMEPFRCRKHQVPPIISDSLRVFDPSMSLPPQWPPRHEGCRKGG